LKAKHSNVTVSILDNQGGYALPAEEDPMTEERVTYGEIRAWFLGSYYSYCRVKLSHKSPWGAGESEAGYAYSELENSFDMPIEKLMLEVLTLVLLAGRSSRAVEKYHLDIISELFKEIDISSALKGLPPDEAAELRADLEALDLYWFRR
jgi:hypothetical protein